MKKLIITCALVSAASAVSFAQNVQTVTTTTSYQKTTTAAPAQNANRQAPTPEQAAEQRAKMYEKQLGLTTEQYKGIYAAELDYIKQDQYMRANGNQPGQGQAAQMMMGKDQKFKNIMTAEQYAKYDKSRTSPYMNRPVAAPNAH